MATLINLNKIGAQITQYKRLQDLSDFFQVSNKGGVVCSHAIREQSKSHIDAGRGGRTTRTRSGGRGRIQSVFAKEVREDIRERSELPQR